MLELIFIELTGVVNDLKENRLSCSDGSLVGDQEEIIDVVSLSLNQGSVDNGA